MSTQNQQATTLCNVWMITRADGEVFGFTDHDRELLVEGVVCQASSGLTGSALQGSTGLSVDNTEAMGALQSTRISSEDITEGKYDSAAVRVLRYNWADACVVKDLFNASIGEISVQDGAFVAELRGLAEPLNQPVGRVYQPSCDAILGDARCGVNTASPTYRGIGTLISIEEGRILRVADVDAYPVKWFERGVAQLVENGVVRASSVIKADKLEAGARVIELWFATNVEASASVEVRLTAGCNRTAGQCRTKFGNMLNFRGFPTVPGEDWAMSYPSSRSVMDGGQR